MSNFTGSHLVTGFDAKKSQALTGQRLAKCRYKTTEKQAAKFPSVCVSVPFFTEDQIDNTPTIARLLPHIRAMLENAQDGVIRSLYESADGALSAVSDTDISIDACIGFLEAEATGGRLTKEFIEAWFKSDVAEIVQAAFAEKWSWTGDLSPEQAAKLEQVSNGHKGMFSALAGGKTVYNIGQCNGLLKVLDLVDSSEVADKLKARLINLRDKPVEVEMIPML